MNKKLVIVLSSAAAVMAACIWGFAFVIVKDSLDYVPPVYMMAFRFTIAAIALSIIYFKKLKLINKSYLLHGAIIGFILFMAYNFQTVGCNYTTAGKNAFLTTIYVILVPLFSWPLYKKRPSASVWIAAIMALVGIGMLSLRNEAGIPVNSQGIKVFGLYMNIGDLLTLICGVFYAFHILTNSQWSKKESTVLLTILQFVFAAIFSWIVAPFQDGAFPVAAIKNNHVIFSMLYLGIFSTMIAYLLQNISLKYLESSFASLFLSLESVFGVVFSLIFLHEKMTPIMIAGCVLIFIAITVAEQFQSKKTK